MTNTLNLAAAGLEASERRVSIAASNIANAGTPGAKAQDAVQNATGGISNVKAVDRNPATITTISGNGEPQELPNTSLDQELVNVQAAKTDFNANALLIKTQRDLDKTLFDIFA